MNSINHKFEYEVSSSEVYSALISGDRISKWWTTDAELIPEEGSEGVFRWSSDGWTVKMRLMKTQEPSYVEWLCTESNMQDTEAWKGTVLKFKIQDNGPKSYLEFSHEGYEESPCRDICNDGWNYVLGESLKALLESGSGHPYSG